MRITLALIILLFNVTHMAAQSDTMAISSYTADFDTLHSALLSDSVPYKRLYDRVFPWAGLDQTTTGDTVSFTLFKQAWYELELSRISLTVPPYVSYRTLADSAYSAALKNKIHLSAIAVKMATIDTLAYIDGRLDSTAAGWAKVSGQPTPYISKDVTIAALAKADLVIGTKYKLELRAAHIQNTDRLTITSIRVTEPANSIDITLTPGQVKDLEVSDTGRYYMTIRINFSGGTYFINKQEIEVRNPPVNPPPCDRTKMVIESDIPYQGFGESEATTSLADVYFYYHRDANGDCEPILKKPIIICDGFDPLDSRDITDIERYFLFSSNNQPMNAIDKLRNLGFDVIIMNFPVIGSEEVEFQSGVRNASNVYVNRDMRDGGADYTERNAMLMVKLIQMVNDSLTANGSGEKLCILGPSMGGQVTRYALAYMEKQNALSVPNMDHNTRVWCSFDSPHHGANIPIGNTALLGALGHILNNTGAKETFDQKLLSKAAQQYLINQTIPLNLNLPFQIDFMLLTQHNEAKNRQIYMNSLTSNGLSGSNGWPQNVKRIAVANASDIGKLTGVPGQQALHIMGKVAFIKAVEFQSFLQNNFNMTNSPIFKAFVRGEGEAYANLTNTNPSGSIDVLPGSLTNSTEEIMQGIIDGINERNKNHWKITVKTLDFIPKHTFMPVISTLAFNDTYVDWTQVLNNRNLVCTGEIPFHAYKISGTNQDHITITEDIYNWLEYQFINGATGCNPVCGSFSISGDRQICDGDTNTIHSYTFNGGIDAGETLTWSVAGDLVIISSSENTAKIKITTTDGSGIVTATLTNACGDKVEQKYQVSIGQPPIYLTYNLDEDECRFLVTINTTPPGKTPLSYQWSTNGISYTNGSVSKEYWMPPHHTSMQVYARTDWGCGYTTDDILLEFPENSNCDNNLPSPALSISDINIDEKFLLTPNPSSSGWNLMIPKEYKEDLYISLFDMSNRLISKKRVENVNNPIFIEGDNLTPGLYFIHISNINNNFTLKAMKI